MENFSQTQRDDAILKTFAFLISRPTLNKETTPAAQNFGEYKAAGVATEKSGNPNTSPTVGEPSA